MATQAGHRTTADYPENEPVSSTRSLIDDAYRLLDEPLAPTRFYAELISLTSQSLGAANVAVWQGAEAGGSTLLCQVGLEHRTLFRSEAAQQQHAQLVANVFGDRRSCSVPLVTAAAESSNHGLPNYVLHLHPVMVEGEVVAAIQLVVTERLESEAGRRTPWVLTAVAAIATAFHHAQDLRDRRQSTQWMTQFEEFVRAIHASLHPREIAYAIANSGPQLLDCDRLVVLLRRGAGYRVVAVTGQTTVHPRANAVRSAERLLKSLPQVEPVIRYPDDEATFAPRELEVFEAYLDETHAKSVAVCFFAATPQDDEETSAGKVQTGGAFIAEKYQGTILPGAEIARAELVANHSAQAVRNAKLHHRVFMLPVWLTLGSWTESVRTHVSRSVLLLLLLSAIVLALVFIPADFELRARGTLQPEQQQHIFARADGTIEELLVDEGQQVAQDEVLARLTNPELDLELEKVVGELRTTDEKLAAAKSSRFVDRGGDRAGMTTDRAELAAQEEELRQWIASLRRQKALLEEQRQDLIVRSPLAGDVITWNVNPTLRQRPVRRGQLLMTVAHLEGPWVLELLAPDRDVGRLLEAQDQLGRPLEVTFAMAANPSDRVVGQIKEIATSIQLEEQEGASLLVTVGFDRRAVTFLQPGATLTAKIHCGRRPLGYVWLHDLIDFFHYRVLIHF